MGHVGIDVFDEYDVRPHLIEIMDECAVTARPEQQAAVRTAERIFPCPRQ
ncbi:MAG: hypothetical protein R2861_06125 [Desulfobacterales bacterium]